MQFVLNRDDNLVSVDNEIMAVDCSSLATNITYVAYPENGIGKITYNDRPAMRVSFTDPAPYQPFINSWITAAAAQTPALQLAQAKQVKIDLVDAIFHHKRRLPYTSGSWQYDARDEAVTNMGELVQGTINVGAANTGLVGSINAALSTITSQVNSSHSTISAWSATNSTQWSNINNTGTIMGGGLTTVGAPNGYVFSTPASGAPAIAGASVTAGATDISYAGNLTIMPLNASAPQSIPAIDIHTALVGIASRRNSLNNNRLTKQVAINALSTIAAVTAYDATTGWSF